MGFWAGTEATNANNSNIFGYYSGWRATNGNNSNYLGAYAGNQATNASYSNFLGTNAGQGANNASNSNFLGQNAGQNASGATNSTLIGYQAGYTSSKPNSIGSNNIVIGTNITLPPNATNRINIGGVLFGSNTYSTTTGNPTTGATSTGRIGIRVVEPTANLHIGPSTTAQALMRLEVGPAPTSPNDGDIWLESNTLTGLKIRISGVTRTINLS